MPINSFLTQSFFNTGFFNTEKTEKSQSAQRLRTLRNTEKQRVFSFLTQGFLTQRRQRSHRAHRD